MRRTEITNWKDCRVGSPDHDSGLDWYSLLFDDPNAAVYVTTEDKGKRYEMLYFQCPCGCKEVVGLPNKPYSFPNGASWEVSLENRSVEPSIQRVGGCASHFFIRAGGAIQWL